MAITSCYSPPHKRPKNLNTATASALDWLAPSWEQKFSNCEKSITVSKEIILQLKSFFRSAVQEEGIRCLSSRICSVYSFNVCAFKYDQNLKIVSITFGK